MERDMRRRSVYLTIRTDGIISQPKLPTYAYCNCIMLLARISRNPLFSTLVLVTRNSACTYEMQR